MYFVSWFASFIFSRGDLTPSTPHKSRLFEFLKNFFSQLNISSLFSVSFFVFFFIQSIHIFHCLFLTWTCHTLNSTVFNCQFTVFLDDQTLYIMFVIWSVSKKFRLSKSLSSFNFSHSSMEFCFESPLLFKWMVLVFCLQKSSLVHILDRSVLSIKISCSFVVFFTKKFASMNSSLSFLSYKRFELP